MKLILTSGKRKRAVARVSLKQGTGKLIVNNTPIALWTPEISRMKILTPVTLAGEEAKKVDITVRVNGGGINSRADAAALAIAKALASNNKKLEKVFAEYDRYLLVADIRRKEVSKPNRHGKARSKRQKSYR